MLSGGGARGAYEAGVLSHLFEKVHPRLGRGFEIDILSGTSVGAIHAGYAAATSHLSGAMRARGLLETWRNMKISDVLHLSGRDLIGIPLRALGITQLSRPETVGGLVDLSPLERIVQEAIPWKRLRGNLNRGRPGALCISCTEVRSGRVTVFMDGPLANPDPWGFDPNARAVRTAIDEHHVRASAAIPFLFPAVKLDERYYVDGALRMNTPLSPVLRLGASRVLVVALKHPHPPSEGLPPYSEDVISQPAFLIGKVLDALTLDQLEYELKRMELVNALLDHGTEAFGSEFLPRLNVAVREKRGVSYRKVEDAVVRPSEDLGRLAAEVFRQSGGFRALGVLPTLVARAALRGVPADEADLLSYLYFDRRYTERLVELGRADAERQEDEIVALFEPG